MATHFLRYHDREITASVKKTETGFVVLVDGSEVTVISKGDGYELSDGARSCLGVAAVGKSRVYTSLDKRLIEFELAGADSVSSAGDSGQAGEKDKLRAPMPGKIVKILVKQGETVSAKQPLAVIESMKMENQLLSPSTGEVKAIHFRAGEQVDAEEVIVELVVE
jgi:biotin carboxyl carrier protein